MTHKQMRKIAKELAECEKIHSDENVSKEQKMQAENHILYITNKIFSEPNGFEIMSEIDDMVQNYLN